MPEEKRAEYLELAGSTLFGYTNQKAALREISDALKNESVLFSTVKGMSLAALYPVPALRTMGDIDFIVSPADMKRAIGILRKLGYKDTEEIYAHEWAGDRNGIHIEVHDELVRRYEHASGKQAAFFNGFPSYIRDGVPDWRFHFLFLIMHLRKHFVEYGVGTRQFMDLAVVIKEKGTELKWEWIGEKLAELEMTAFASSCFFLVNRWFGVSVPIAYSPMDEAFFEKVTALVLKNGTFGFSNPEHIKNDRLSDLAFSKGPLWIRRLSGLRKSMFPEYSYMRGYSVCGYLDGRPYLLPVAWIHRLCFLAFSPGGQNVRNRLKARSSDVSGLEEHQAILEKMGIQNGTETGMGNSENE